MKKTILFTLIIGVGLVLAGCVKLNQTNQNSNLNNNQTPAAEQPKVLTYQNDKYGFSLELPIAWQGFTTKESKTGFTDTVKDVDTTEFLFNGNSIFAIHAFTKAQWAASNDALPGLSILGENASYVFVSEVSNGPDESVLDRLQEVSAILKTFKLNQ